MESDYLFGNFLQRFVQRTNEPKPAGQAQSREARSVAVMEELMQAALVERHVASGLTPIASPYIREEAGTQRYKVGIDTPKLCATTVIFPVRSLGPGGVWNRSPALDRVEIPAFFAGALFGNGLVSRGSGLAVLYPCTLAGSGLAIGRRHSLYGRRLVLPG